MEPSSDMDLLVRDRLLLYARGLDLPPKESIALALESLERCACEHPDHAEALDSLHQILEERRLSAGLSEEAPSLSSVPPMKRSTMLPEELDRTPWMTIFRKTFRRMSVALTPKNVRDSWKRSAERQRQQMSWKQAAGFRRTLLMTLILVPAFIGAFLMYGILPPQGIEAVKIITSVLLAILFGWISIGFWMCAAGCWTLLRKTDRFAATHGCDAVTIAEDCRTAILFPVYNEDPRKYMAGIAATWHSLNLLNDFTL